MTARWLTSLNYMRFSIFKWLSRKANQKSKLLSVAFEDSGNSGLCVVNRSAHELAYKTVIVIGQERSGTSMIAGTLAKLGVYMGETLSITYEDHEINRCLRAGDKKSARAIIDKRNQAYSIWGLKKPTGLLLQRSWQELFREPVYVVVFRDIFAIANRRSVSGGVDLFSGLYDALNRYYRILRFVQNTKRPVLMVSYEKALLNPEVFLKNLSGFLGIENEKAKADIIKFIEPSPKGYHAASTVHQGWRGTLERVEATTVTGWAFRNGNKNPVHVVLTLADGTKVTSQANLSRLDVKQYYNHVSEFCGFQFQLETSQSIILDDTISVRIEGENFDILNSPCTCHRFGQLYPT